MYSYEERVRAVDLYIKLGKRVAATIQQLGYPTKNALKSWYLEYEQRLDLPRGYVRSKPKYSQAQMKLAVEHYLEHGRCIAATIKALRYPVRVRCVPGFTRCTPSFKRVSSSDLRAWRARQR